MDGGVVRVSTDAQLLFKMLISRASPSFLSLSITVANLRSEIPCSIISFLSFCSILSF